MPDDSSIGAAFGGAPYGSNSLKPAPYSAKACCIREPYPAVATDTQTIANDIRQVLWRTRSAEIPRPLQMANLLSAGLVAAKLKKRRKERCLGMGTIPFKAYAVLLAESFHFQLPNMDFLAQPYNPAVPHIQIISSGMYGFSLADREIKALSHAFQERAVGIRKARIGNAIIVSSCSGKIHVPNHFPHFRPL